MKRVVLLILFSALSASTVSAQTPEAAGRDVETKLVAVRHSDSLLNGALIGAGVAVASGLLVCRTMEPWENCRDDVGPRLRIGAIGAAIGIGIDALIRKTVYETASGSSRLDAAPLVARRGGGLKLSLSF
jgi:hypothetical protein